MKKVKTVLNPCGLRVKKCCASCINKLVDNDGMRLCPIHNLFVESGHVCKKWKMDYNTSQAGVCRGRVHQKEYLMFALAIRLDEGVEALRAKKQATYLSPSPERSRVSDVNTKRIMAKQFCWMS